MSKPIPAIVIQRAREIISDEQHWCRGSYARGRAGAPVSINHPDARRYCAMGALMLAAQEMSSDFATAEELVYRAAQIISPTGSLVVTNDYEGHVAVLALFDAALGTL